MKSAETDFIPSSTWKGAKEGYYFGTTTELGTGYYCDINSNNSNHNNHNIVRGAEGAATATSSAKAKANVIQQQEYADSNNGNKRKRVITIDESRNEVQFVPHRLSAEELLEQAEDELRQGKYNTSNKIIELNEKGVQSAVTTLAKLHQTNSLQRAQHDDSANHPETDDPNLATSTAHAYMESELALHDQLQAFSGVATHPQFFSLLDLQLCAELLSHPNSDIAIALVHVWVEWMEVDSDGTDDDYARARESIYQFARSIFFYDSSSLVELMVANLGRLNILDNSDEHHDTQGSEDILTCLEQLVELVDSNAVEQNIPMPYTLAEFIAKETTLVSWLVSQVQHRHARSAEILVLLVQQPALHAQITDWTKLPAYSSILVDEEEEEETDKKSTTLDALEIMLQTLAPFRKQQPVGSSEVDLVENIVLVLASLLVFAPASDGKTKEDRDHMFLSQFLNAQGPELIIRCLKEKVHLGGIGLALLDLRDKDACEHLVTKVALLKFIFPLWMGHSTPKPAAISGTTLSKKEKRMWLKKLEEYAIHIMYNLTRFLDEKSPEDAKQRLLVQFLGQDRLDRLVELLLQYDDKARKAEYKFYRSMKEDVEDDESLAASSLSAKLAGGRDLFHRLGAICAFVCINSKRSHTHVLQQLILQQSGIGLVKEALQEFVSILEEEGDQKKQLQSYLDQL